MNTSGSWSRFRGRKESARFKKDIYRVPVYEDKSAKISQSDIDQAMKEYEGGVTKQGIPTGKLKPGVFMVGQRGGRKGGW